MDEANPQDAERNRQLASEGMELIQSLGDTLLAWTGVPPAIIQATLTRQTMTVPQHLLVRSTRKLCEDFGAAVVVLQSGFVGTSYALLRMCRENLVSMLYLALAAPAETERYARFLAEQEPASARLKLHRRVKAIIEKLGNDLPRGARDRLSAGLLGDAQLRSDEALDKRDTKAKEDYKFGRLVTRVADLLRHEHGPEALTFVTAVVDYHIESEVTHSGFDSIAAYHVDGEDWRNNLRHIGDVLTSLMDLRVFAAQTTAALLAPGTAGKMRKPDAVKALADSAAATQAYLQRVWAAEPKS